MTLPRSDRSVVGPALVILVLAGSALLPMPAPWLAALVAVIVLGIPHGALDGEIARDVLRPQLGRGWFLAFAVPYLALAAAVLLAWRIAPATTLAVFLAASVWHFGAEDSAGGPAIESLARGGLPIAVPVLVHPQATAAIFETVIGRSLAGAWTWWMLGGCLWLATAGFWAISRGRSALPVDLLRTGLLLGSFVVLPPLTAFALYFVSVHAPAHTRALVANRGRASRVVDARSALVRSLPLTVVTLAIGAALWRLYPGTVPDRLLSLTIQGLAALTLPHILLDLWLSRRERHATLQRARPVPHRIDSTVSAT